MDGPTSNELTLIWLTSNWPAYKLTSSGLTLIWLTSNGLTSI